MTILHHDTKQGAQHVAQGPKLDSNGSNLGNFATRRAHFVQVGRAIADAYKASGVAK